MTDADIAWVHGSGPGRTALGLLPRADLRLWQGEPGGRPSARFVVIDRSRIAERYSWTAIVGLIGVISKSVRLRTQGEHNSPGDQT
jgi:hypothetical protein